MYIMRKWCLGTFQDLRGLVMSTVNVQSFLDMSKHIDQSFVRFVGVFIVYTSTCNFFMLNSSQETRCRGILYYYHPDEPYEHG